MKKEIVYMDIKEFREKGYLQEVNRLFFHPLGLALEIKINKKGIETLSRIWDSREDAEGIYYALNGNPFNVNEKIYKQRFKVFKKKAKFIKKEVKKRKKKRIKELGFWIEPIN